MILLRDKQMINYLGKPSKKLILIANMLAKSIGGKTLVF